MRVAMNLRARVYSPESQCGNLGEFFWNEHLTYIHMKAEINILKNRSWNEPF
jgi:hypothetical protein